MRCILALNVLLLLIGSTDAHAFQPKKACPKLPKDPVKAQILAGELFADAEQKYAESHPLEALEGFLCSHHVIQHENTLFNIAQIAKVSQLKDRALELLKDYVRHVKRTTKTAPIQDIIDELESEEASVAPVPASEEATREAPKPELVPLTAVFGESDAPEPEERSSTNVRKVISLVLFGTGGAALIAGGVMQGLAGRSQSLAEDTDRYTTYRSESDKMSLFQKFAIAGFANGGVLIGAGLALLILSNRNEREGENGASFSIGTTPNSVLFSGRF